MAYFYEHRYDQAYAALENAIAIDSRATWWHYALQIKLLADTGNSVAFQHSFNKGQNPTTYARNLALDIAENQPDGLPKHLLLGDLYLTLDDTHAAVETYRHAVVVAPDHAPVHFGYAQALFAHHPPDPLRHRYPSYVPAMPYLAHFRKAIDLAPYRTDYRLRFVEVLLRIPENDYDPALALEHAETATHLDPYNECSWKLWARVMKYGDPQRNLSENSSNLRAALGILDRAEAYIHPNRLLFVRAILQYLLDNRQEAFLLFTRHAQAFPYYSPRLEFEEWCSQPEYFDWDVELQQFLA